MPAIQEYAQVVVEHYDYTQSAWVQDAELGDDKIISAGIRKQCCPDGAFSIGGVYAAMLSIICRMPGMSYFHVRSARLTVKHKYNSELNYTQLGVFYVTDCKRLAGDLFQISAQDAVGWTDTSSKNYNKRDGVQEDPVLDTKYGVGAFMDYYQKHQPDKPYPVNAYTNLQDWMRRLTDDITERLIFGQCGIHNMVQWENYSTTNNAGFDYTNSHRNDDHGPRTEGAIFPFYVYNNDEKNIQGSARTDSPRDFYRFLSELTFGFVYAKENGNLTLGQFGQPEFGWNDPENGDSTQAITPNDVEDGSCEIADYTIQLLSAEVSAESYHGWSKSSVFATNPDYSQNSYIVVGITEDNPFACGWHAQIDQDLGSIAWGLWNHINTSPGVGYAGGCTIRPFHATVHKPVRFHLGQRIKFVGFDTNDLLSIVTSIQWNFRGGWKIACGGEDGRSMFDCVRATKGDRVARDLRNTITALRDQS